MPGQRPFVPLIDVPSLVGYRYWIKCPLGAGGHSQVYLAHDLTLKRDVAIKVSRDLSLEPEAQRLASLRHPGIPQVYDVWRREGLWYLSMEYLEGKTLAEHLLQLERDGLAMSIEEVLQVSIQLCEILMELHCDEDRAPIIFCDLKPGNIMLGPQSVSLFDFGISYQYRLSRPGEAREMTSPALYGTRGYLAPEYFSGCITPRSDVYALGVVMYQMLLGELFQECICDQSPCTCGAFVLARLRGPLGTLIMRMIEPVFGDRIKDVRTVHVRLRRMRDHLRTLTRWRPLAEWYRGFLVSQEEHLTGEGTGEEEMQTLI